MKILIAILSVLAIAMAEELNYPSKFGDMRAPCINITVDQIGCEVRASLEYLKFGAYWSMDNVNRPGFAKFFFESSSEEREHAIKLIDYMNMRGAHHPGTAKENNNLKALEPLLKHAKECTIFDSIKDICDFNAENFNGASALNCALQMEIAVTNHIKEVIKQCEVVEKCAVTDHKCQENDYHVSFLFSLLPPLYFLNQYFKMYFTVC